MPTITEIRWRKSSHSNSTGACVEVAPLPDHFVAVRDSKDPDGAILLFTAPQWRRFLNRHRPALPGASDVAEDR